MYEIKQPNQLWGAVVDPNTEKSGFTGSYADGWSDGYGSGVLGAILATTLCSFPHRTGVVYVNSDQDEDVLSEYLSDRSSWSHLVEVSMDLGQEIFRREQGIVDLTLAGLPGLRGRFDVVALTMTSSEIGGVPTDYFLFPW